MTRRGALTALIGALVCLGTPAFAASSPSVPRVNTAPCGGELRGTVTGAGDGLGLKQVQVVLRHDETKEVLQSRTTGRDGAFDFDGVPSGIYSLEATAPGYRRAILAPVVIRGGEARVEHLTLTPTAERPPSS